MGVNDMMEIKYFVDFSNMDESLNNSDNCTFTREFNILCDSEKSGMIQLINEIYNHKPYNISVDKITIVEII